jgi:serine/threonine-protein kinase RsbW
MMSSQTAEVCCTIESRIENIDMVQFLGEKLGQFFGLGDDDCSRVGTALREALNNAVAHGNGMDPRKKVRVAFQVRGQELRITVKDEGPGFASDKIPDPRDPKNLLKTSGRGIFSITKLMDGVDLSHTSSKGGEIRMYKQLPPARRENAFQESGKK